VTARMKSSSAQTATCTSFTDSVFSIKTNKESLYNMGIFLCYFSAAPSINPQSVIRNMKDIQHLENKYSKRSDLTGCTLFNLKITAVSWQHCPSTWLPIFPYIRLYNTAFFLVDIKAKKITGWLQSKQSQPDML